MTAAVCVWLEPAWIGGRAAGRLPPPDLPLLACGASPPLRGRKLVA